MFFKSERVELSTERELHTAVFQEKQITSRKTLVTEISVGTVGHNDFFLF